VGYITSKRNLNQDVQNSLMHKIKPIENPDPSEMTSETFLANKKFRKNVE